MSSRTALETPSDAQQWLAQNGIRAVRVEWSDLNGLGRGKLVPAERFVDVCRDGIQFSNAALTFDVLSIPAPTAGLGAATGYQNVRAIPDLATLRAWPVGSGVAWCLCSVESLGGTPVEVSPQHFSARIGQELEGGWHGRGPPL